MPVCAKAMALQLYLAEGAAVFPRLAVMLVVWMQIFQVAPKNTFCNTASEPPYSAYLARTRHGAGRPKRWAL